MNPKHKKIFRIIQISIAVVLIGLLCYVQLRMAFEVQGRAEIVSIDPHAQTMTVKDISENIYCFGSEAVIDFSEAALEDTSGTAVDASELEAGDTIVLHVKASKPEYDNGRMSEYRKNMTAIQITAE